MAPDSLERIRSSRAGRYLKSYMTPAVEAIRFLILIPVAYGAWRHEFWPIWLGLTVLVLAWLNGFIFLGGISILRRSISLDLAAQGWDARHISGYQLIQSALNCWQYFGNPIQLPPP
jgi:hypothetical protein